MGEGEGEGERARERDRERDMEAENNDVLLMGAVEKESFPLIPFKHGEGERKRVREMEAKHNNVLLMGAEEENVPIIPSKLARLIDSSGTPMRNFQEDGCANQWCAECLSNESFERLPKNGSLSGKTMIGNACHTKCDDLPNTIGKHSEIVSLTWCPWESFLAGSIRQAIRPESACCALPRLMTFVNNGMVCRFINCLPAERFEMDWPGIGKTRCLYSRRGWLLLCMRDPKFSNRSLFILLNPLRNQKIELPFAFCPHRGAFSISATDENASPDCVILFDANMHSGCMDINVWHPGSKKWSEYTGECDGYDKPEDIVFCGRRVRCFCRSGMMYAFDLYTDGGTWALPRRIYDPHCKRGDWNYFMLGQDGKEIWKILSFGPPGRLEYRFYKLDLLELEWIQLENEELMGRSWFLNLEFSLSTNAGEGNRVYRTESSNYGQGVNVIVDGLVNVMVDDLVDGRTHKLVPGFSCEGFFTDWVELEI